MKEFNIKEHKGKCVMVCYAKDSLIFCRYLKKLNVNWKIYPVYEGTTEKFYAEHGYFDYISHDYISFNCFAKMSNLSFEEEGFTILNYKDFDWSKDLIDNPEKAYWDY